MIATATPAGRPGRCCYSLFALLVCLAVPLAWAKGETKYLNPVDFDLKAIIGEPPADDSPEHRAEVDRMLDYQAHRTHADENRCKSEEEVTAFIFAEVLGDAFNAKDLPLTAALMQQVFDDTRAVSGGAKKIWNRTRPPFAEPRIKPCVVLEHTGSYPSGHATRGVVWAGVLAEIFPDYREKLMARGKLIGDDRYIAGMHFPSDVAAGQKLGAAIAAKLLKNPEFQTALAKAKEECQAAMRK